MSDSAAAYDSLLAMGATSSAKRCSPGTVEAYLAIAEQVVKVQNVRGQKLHEAAISASRMAAYAECAKKYPRRLLMKSADRKKCEADAASVAAGVPPFARVAVARTSDPYADFARAAKPVHEEVHKFVATAKQQAAGHTQLAKVMMLSCVPEMMLFAVVDLEKFQDMLDASDTGALHRILSILNGLQSETNILTALKTKQATISAIMKSLVYVRGVFGADYAPEQKARLLQRVDPLLLAMFGAVIRDDAVKLLPKRGGGFLGDIGWAIFEAEPVLSTIAALFVMSAIAVEAAEVLMAIPNLISYAWAREYDGPGRGRTRRIWYSPRRAAIAYFKDMWHRYENVQEPGRTRSDYGPPPPAVDVEKALRTMGLERPARYDAVFLNKLTKAFKKLALQSHPDKHRNSSPDVKAAAEVKMREINEAYAVLKAKCPQNGGGRSRAARRKAPDRSKRRRAPAQQKAMSRRR
jgi:hypothetical protein